MPRALRIEYPGAIYHVMNRGDRREPIFRDDLDHKKFLTTLAETAFKKKIDAFDKLKVAPRDGVITRRAAGELQEQLVRTAATILRDKLDRLVV